MIAFVVAAAMTWLGLCLLSDRFCRWYLRVCWATELGRISWSRLLTLPIPTVPFVMLEVVPAYVAWRRMRARIRRDLHEMRREAVDLLARLDAGNAVDPEARRYFQSQIAEMDRRLKNVS